MGTGSIFEASLRVEEIVGLVDVQALVGEAAVLVLVELVVDAAGGVAHEAVLQVCECLETVAEGVSRFDKAAEVGLDCVGIVVEVVPVGEFVGLGFLEIVQQLLVFDIGQVAVVPAVEVLRGKTEAKVELLGLSACIGDEPVSVLREALLADEVGFLDLIAVSVKEYQAEFGELGVRFEFLVIA